MVPVLWFWIISWLEKEDLACDAAWVVAYLSGCSDVSWDGALNWDGAMTAGMVQWRQLGWCTELGAMTSAGMVQWRQMGWCIELGWCSDVIWDSAVTSAGMVQWPQLRWCGDISWNGVHSDITRDGGTAADDCRFLSQWRSVWFSLKLRAATQAEAHSDFSKRGQDHAVFRKAL